MKKLFSLILTILTMTGTINAQEKSKSALILIETQNEWMHPDGKLNKALVKDKEMMQTSITNIEKALDYARKNNIEVIHVGLRFEKGYPELANGKSGLRKAIPNAGTFPINGFGSQFYEKVKPIEGEFIVTGRVGASGFTGSNLDAYLRNNKIENLYLVGYATHVCVESTLRDAHDKGYNTFLISDAASAFNQEQQDYVLKEIVHHFGEHITTEEFTKINKNRKMSTTNDSTAPIKAFFDAFAKGDFEGILNAFHAETTITGIREDERKEKDLYGTYKGIEGVKEFLTKLGNTFDTQSFSVENIIGGEGIAFANGKFVHKVKATGKLFPSDWALYAVIRDGEIYEYHFYEDSARFEEANTK